MTYIARHPLDAYAPAEFDAFTRRDIAARVAADLAAARALVAAAQAFRETVERLSFGLCPVSGYDHADIIDLIRKDFEGIDFAAYERDSYAHHADAARESEG